MERLRNSIGKVKVKIKIQYSGFPEGAVRERYLGTAQGQNRENTVSNVAVARCSSLLCVVSEVIGSAIGRRVTGIRDTFHRPNILQYLQARLPKTWQLDHVPAISEMRDSFRIWRLTCQ